MRLVLLQVDAAHKEVVQSCICQRCQVVIICQAISASFQMLTQLTSQTRNDLSILYYACTMAKAIEPGFTLSWVAADNEHGCLCVTACLRLLRHDNIHFVH